MAAAMFQSMPRGEDLELQLSADDIACVTAVYPATGSAGMFGTIAGADSLGGAPVRGASVVALDVNAGVTVASLSSRDGTFAVSGLPPGSYMLYAEPLVGPVLPANLNASSSQIDTAFSSGFLGSVGNPLTLEVSGGATVRAILSAHPAADLRIAAIGLGSPGGSGDFSEFGEGAIQLASGQSTDLMLTGPGIDESVLEGGVKLLGPALHVRPGSTRIDPSLILNGMLIIRLTVDVSPRSSMAVGSIVVMQGDSAATYTAALVITASHPSFTAASLVNAASYAGGGVAPGEIATLFGSGLGPPEAIQSSGFDAASGGLPVELGRVAVTFDDVPAPLFYVSAGQINLRAPFEIAGKQTTTVVVTSAGIPSTRIEVKLVTAHPLHIRWERNIPSHRTQSGRQDQLGVTSGPVRECDHSIRDRCRHSKSAG
ncbi:MAG: hypothetical protein DMG57_42800 [Acidobacteria bacterium]|nr:MAG: hypothetical protein DMG57_42800 [Acidobacteriota bacterium]